MVSRVRRATPPRCPRAGDGRMKARSSTARRSMRVLSPRMLPPEIGLDGSTLSTATLSPRSRIRYMPSASMKVLLPTPGTPVMPTRRDLPVCGRMASSSRAAKSPSAGSSLSITVMARARITESPFRMPSTYVSRGSRRGWTEATSAGLCRTNGPHQGVQNFLCTDRDNGARAEYARHASLI